MCSNNMKMPSTVLLFLLLLMKRMDDFCTQRMMVVASLWMKVKLLAEKRPKLVNYLLWHSWDIVVDAKLSINVEEP